MSEPLLFRHEDTSYSIDVEDLTRALVVHRDNSASLDTEALQDRFQHIAHAVARSPRNVKLGWNGGLYVVKDDEDGSEVDLQALTMQIQQMDESDHRTVELPICPV